MAPTPSTPASVATIAAPAPTSEAARERALSRFTARDYSYVRREIARILVIATAIFILILVLSFFLP